jgi:hypothetical protein
MIEACRQSQGPTPLAVEIDVISVSMTQSVKFIIKSVLQESIPGQTMNNLHVS